jgi:hypothetical protein
MTDAPNVFGYFAGGAGEVYEQTLIGLKSVLEAAGSNSWSAWIGRSLDEWRTSGTCSVLRSAYGGMGSLNDLVVAGNADPRLVWLDPPLELLRAAAYQWSSVASDAPTTFKTTPASTHGLRLRWYECDACHLRVAGTFERAMAAADAWSSWAVPRLVSLRQAHEIVEASGGKTVDFPTAPYTAHLELQYEKLSVKRLDLGRHWEDLCPRCGAIAWRYSSAAAF